MSERVTISLPDQAHAFAKALVARGEFATMSAALAAGLAALREREEERRVALDAMADEIRRRAEALDADFVAHRDGDFLRLLDESPDASGRR